MKILNFLTSKLLSQFLFVISFALAIVVTLHYDGSSSQVQAYATINLLLLVNVINAFYRELFF